MEVVYKKKLIILFFNRPHDKFLTSPLLTPLEKKFGATTDSMYNLYFIILIQY